MRLDVSFKHDVARRHRGAIVRPVQIISCTYGGTFNGHTGVYPLCAGVCDEIHSYTLRDHSLYATPARTEGSRHISPELDRILQQTFDSFYGLNDEDRFRRFHARLSSEA